VFSGVRKRIKPLFLKQLLRCPYCLSHWLAGVAALTVSVSFIDWVINSFAIVCLSSIFSIGIYIFITLVDHDIN